jgi:signal transduction histidine kinase/CheY-like chemotaxis protein
MPLLGLFILVFLGLGYTSARAQINHQAQVARSLSQLADYHLQQGEHILLALANTVEATGSREAGIFMRSTWDAYGYFETLYHLDENNRVSQVMPEDPRFAGLDFSNVPGVGDPLHGVPAPYLSVRTGEPVVLLTQTIPSGGKLVGELRLGLLQQEIAAIQRQSTGEFVFITDQNGTLLAHPDPRAVLERDNVSQLPVFLRLNRNAKPMVYDMGGTSYLGLSVPVQRTDWVVVDQVPLRRFCWTYLSAIVEIFLASLILWFVSWYWLRARLDRQVSKPLNVLGQMTEAITRGQFQDVAATPRPDPAFAELDQLSANFRQMAVRLHLREEELRRNEAQTTSLLRAIPDLIFMLGRDGEYITCHVGDESAVYMPMEAFQHRKIQEVLPEPLGRQFQEVIGAVLGGNTVRSLEYSLIIQGEERNFEARVAPCGPDVVIAVVRDMTRQKRGEAQRLNLQLQLQQAQKMESLGNLAGGVAHDMNNVLGAILGIASFLQEMRPEGEHLGKAADTIVKAANRGAELVRNLLRFARQEPIRRNNLDLNSLVGDVAQLLERTTLAKINLALDLAPALRPVSGDPSSLTHSLMNICVNSVDAMPNGGTLTMRTRNVDDGWVEIAITDTGCGMPPEVLQKALDPFFTTKGTGKGTGLGLTMVYSTVKAHGGWMDLQSEPGKGTCVTLRFRPAEPGGAPSEPQDVDGPPVQAHALKILVVDDDELMQVTLLRLLETLGHVPVTAADGESALVSLAEGSLPNLILLDMNMPGLGGMGTLPRIRANHPALPVVLITGKADQDALALVQTYPCVSLLPKPFSLGELRDRIESCTSTHSLGG